jgi:hypothetical protein
MSSASSLYVTDRKGVVVGSWKRGEVFTVLSGDSIIINSSGIATYKGVVLNLPVNVRQKLVAARRVVVKG